MAKATLVLVVALMLLPVATAFLSLEALRVAKIGNYKVKLQISVEETAMDDATFDSTTKHAFVQLNRKGGKSKSRLKGTEKPLAKLPDILAPANTIPGALDVGEPSSWPALAMALLDSTSALKRPPQEVLFIVVLAALLAKVCFPDLPLRSTFVLAATLTTVVKQQRTQLHYFATGGGISRGLPGQH